MAFLEIKRVCKECETTRAELVSLRREVENFRLDYENLYEKVRSNLAKLRKRAESLADEQTQHEAGDPLAQYRTLILERRRRKA